MIDKFRILITGAAGQIGYSILPYLARGEAIASSKSIHLVMHDLPAKGVLMEGIAMELEDCAFHHLDGISIITNPEEAFKNIDLAVLLASCPWKTGMSRADLLGMNKDIFASQGAFFSKHAKDKSRVIVVGNPANTNAYIFYKNASGMDPSNISCLSRLDHNRSVFQIAKKVDCDPSEVKKIAVWGNHSSTQVPDASFSETIKKVNGETVTDRVVDQIDQKWLEDDFIKIIRDRVWEVAERRKNTSALSPAVATINHLKNWFCGTPKDDWVSMGLCSDGSYDVPKGLISSFPVTVSHLGKAKIVPNLALTEKARELLRISVKEMQEEIKNAGLQP